jgi:hypothetical protein
MSVPLTSWKAPGHDFKEQSSPKKPSTQMQWPSTQRPLPSGSEQSLSHKELATAAPGSARMRIAKASFSCAPIAVAVIANATSTKSFMLPSIQKS